MCLCPALPPLSLKLTNLCKVYFSVGRTRGDEAKHMESVREQIWEQTSQSLITSWKGSADAGLLFTLFISQQLIYILDGSLPRKRQFPADLKSWRRNFQLSRMGTWAGCFLQMIRAHHYGGALQRLQRPTAKLNIYLQQISKGGENLHRGRLRFIWGRASLKPEGSKEISAALLSAAAPLFRTNHRAELWSSRGSGFYSRQEMNKRRPKSWKHHGTKVRKWQSRTDPSWSLWFDSLPCLEKDQNQSSPFNVIKSMIHTSQSKTKHIILELFEYNWIPSYFS